MNDALHDLTESNVTPEYIRRRVDDWVRRINELYDKSEKWLHPPYKASRSDSVSMHEELMQKFGIPQKNLPIFEVKKDGMICGTIKPHGLWIIGANGRLDFRTTKATFIIIDRAAAFDTPSWYMAPLADRTRFEPLTQGAFVQSL